MNSFIKMISQRVFPHLGICLNPSVYRFSALWANEALFFMAFCVVFKVDPIGVVVLGVCFLTLLLQNG
jgi:hypothetical protein